MKSTTLSIALGSTTALVLLAGCASGSNSPYLSAASKPSSGQVVTAALGYYCASAPLNSDAWVNTSPVPINGIVQVYALTVGGMINLNLSFGTGLVTIKPADSYASAALDAWKCPDQMQVRID